MSDLLEAAEKALQSAALDPGGARTLSRSVLETAVPERAWEVVSTAERALGVAAMTLSEIDEAIVHLRAAVLAGRRARCSRRVGEARMSLASALVLRGQAGRAAREIEAATRDLSGVEAARAHVQRAAILQELGKDNDALHELRRALPTLRRAGDAEWAARGLSNRSLIHVRRRAFGAAEADLLEARGLCIEHGLELPAGYAEQNLGFVDAQRGDVPASLQHFDEAASRYRQFGLVEASLLLDRAGVLLSVRLVEEARAAAEQAVEAYLEQGRDVHVPAAQLMLSTVALLQGDTVTATSSASDAITRFRRLGHAHSVALAKYSSMQALVAADPTSVSHLRLARVADELEAAGWRVPALEARVLAGRVALDRGDRSAARHHLSVASKARMVGPADARARAWLAEAMLRKADGRRPAALSALRAGLRIVEDHQATLGAVELRAHVSAHRGALARLGLRMQIEDGDARRALLWAERGRASALFRRQAEPPADPELARELADLRSTMTELDEARRDGAADGRLVRRQVALERRIRDRSRNLEGENRAAGLRTRESTDELVARVGDSALVEFIELEGSLHAVSVASGRVRLHTLGEIGPLREVLARVPFVLRRLAMSRSRTAGVDAAAAMLQGAATTFDDQLLRPLAAQLRDRPLVLVPTGALQSIPWSVLPSCLGRPVTVSPSAALWNRAASRPGPEQGAEVVVVAGPGLPGAMTEAASIAKMYAESVLLTGDDAISTCLTAHMDSAAMLHLAAHGQVRSDNPLFSSLKLADGPLTVYELDRLARLPHHVVLSACDTGQSQTVAGEEILGFGAAMLGGGTATLVAPVVAVSDLATVPLMVTYHRGLLAHRSPAEALSAAQAEVDPDDHMGRAAAAAFICLGAG